MSVFYLVPEDTSTANLVAKKNNKNASCLYKASTGTAMTDIIAGATQINTSALKDNKVTLVGHTDENGSTVGEKDPKQLAQTLAKLYESDKGKLTDIYLLACESGMSKKGAYFWSGAKQIPFGQALADELGKIGFNHIRIHAAAPPPGAYAMRVAIDTEPGLAERLLGAKEGQVSAFSYGNKETEDYESILNELKEKQNTLRSTSLPKEKKARKELIQEREQAQKKIAQHEQSKRQGIHDQITRIMSDRNFKGDYELMMDAKGITFRPTLPNMSEQVKAAIEWFESRKALFPIDPPDKLIAYLKSIDECIDELRKSPEKLSTSSQSFIKNTGFNDGDGMAPIDAETDPVKALVDASFKAEEAKLFYEAALETSTIQSPLMKFLIKAGVFPNALADAEKEKIEALSAESKLNAAHTRTEKLVEACKNETAQRLVAAEEHVIFIKESQDTDNFFIKFLRNVGITANPLPAAEIAESASRNQLNHLTQELNEIRDKKSQEISARMISALASARNVLFDNVKAVGRAIGEGVKAGYYTVVGKATPPDPLFSRVINYADKTDKPEAKQRVAKALLFFLRSDHTEENWSDFLNTTKESINIAYKDSSIFRSSTIVKLINDVDLQYFPKGHLVQSSNKPVIIHSEELPAGPLRNDIEKFINRCSTLIDNKLSDKTNTALANVVSAFKRSLDTSQPPILDKVDLNQISRTFKKEVDNLTQQLNALNCESNNQAPSFR